MTDLLTLDMLMRYSTDLIEKRPPTPTEAEVMFGRLPQVVSFAPAVTNTSFIARFRMKDDTLVDLEINPVAAQGLVQSIATLAVQAGWMDADGDIISPPMPGHDA